VPGAADISNPSDPTPAQVPIQELYNHKVRCAACAAAVQIINPLVATHQTALSASNAHAPSPPPLPPPHTAQVIQLAFLVACLYTGVGVLRFGWLIHFLSHSVITGFTSGAAIIIALSQVRACVCVCKFLGCLGVCG